MYVCNKDDSFNDWQNNFIVHLIVCENLFIYFFPERMARIITGDKNIRGVSRKCSVRNSAASVEEINASPF